MNKNLVSKYISKAAKKFVKQSNYTYREVSKKLNVSYGFFRQLMSNNRSLTTIDIYKLARIENKPVSHFFPPINGSSKSFDMYKLVTGDKSHQDFIKFLKQLDS